MAIYDAPESLHLGTGSETVFGFNWPYLLPRDLRVTVNGTDVPVVLASPNQVSVTPAPAPTTLVRIFRNTPAQDPTYLFATGIPMLPKYIDGNNKQLLYSLQEGLLSFGQVKEVSDEALRVALIADHKATDAVTQVSRTVRMADGEVGQVLPPRVQMANKIVTTDALGNFGFRAPQLRPDEEVLAYLAGGSGAGSIGTSHGPTVQEEVEYLRGKFVNVKRFGIVAGRDQTRAIQDALDSGEHLYFPPDELAYLTSEPVFPQDGQWTTGFAGSKFIDAARKTRFESMFPNTPFFNTDRTHSGQAAAPKFADFCLKSDYGIILNDPQALIVDGPTSPVPYFMQARLKDLYVEPVTPGEGVGISLSKVFDGVMHGCYLYNFRTNLLLNGCDLNHIHLNRIRNATDYNILEVSAGTFGSQNFIHHNDILIVKANGTHYASSNRHITFFKNYLEQTSPCKGFIDLGSQSLPGFGLNAQSANFSTIVDTNRIDGHVHGSEFVYKLNPRGVFVKIHDVGTVGPGSDAAKQLVIEGGGLPILYNAVNSCTYDLVGPRFGGFNGHQTKGNFDEGDACLVVNNRTLPSMQGIYGNLAYQFIRLKSRSILLKSNMNVATQWTFPPGTLVQPYLSNSEWYTATFRMRTVNAGTDRIAAGILKAGALIGQVTEFVVNSQFQDFIVTFQGPTSAEALGVHLARSTNNLDVEVQSVVIKRGVYRTGGFTVGAVKSVAPGTGVQYVAPVPGALRGEYARAVYSVSAGGFMISALVAATGQVQVTFFNPLTTALVLNPGDIYVEVTK